MDILGKSFVLLDADGIINGSAPDSVWSAESPGAQTAAPAETGTSTGTPQGTEASQDAPQPGSPYTIILIYGVMLFAMYFFLFRPQRKQAKAMKALQEELKTGENIVTSNGMFGKIVGVGEDSFLVEFGENRGVRIWIRKSDITGIKTPITTPVPADSIEDKSKK